MVSLAEKYNNAANEYYEQKYVEGGWEKNPYMEDEHDAHMFWLANKNQGKIISLGIGSGQDIPILNMPHPEYFVGYDISEGMLNNARKKFPDYKFELADCNNHIDDECNILVSIFGTPNYIGLPKLLEHYSNFKASHAFFVFYAEWYDDGFNEKYHKYTKDELEEALKEFNPTVEYLNENYYIVKW